MHDDFGYSEQKLESNRYRVWFAGNSKTPRETVENYVLYRAAEITLDNGYDYFVMSERSTEGDRKRSGGVSLGIGGFGFGRHSAGGVGVSAPIGGGQVSSGYSASSRVTDVASGRLMWSARATTPPSSDINAQLADLSKTVVDAAQKAGLF